MPITKPVEPYRNIPFHSEQLKVLHLAERTSYINAVQDFQKDFHEEIEIKLFYEGSSTLLVGNESTVAVPGDVVFINPYEFHSTIGFGEQKGKYHLLLVGLDFFGNENRDLLDLRYLFVKERVRIQTLIRGNHTVSRIVSDIVAELNDRKPQYEQVVRGLLLQLFVLLLRDYRCADEATRPVNKQTHYYDVIYPAIRKIRTTYAERLSVDELAALCNVSKSHFCRIFKKATSMTVIQYQNECRLSIADALLKASNMSIQEVSEHCGFNDMGYFGRCYKRRFGESPLKRRSNF